ncbi:MAG: outer membrane beta-barrel protein [Bacteroidota bacterium]|nr:outer membrane beta-barrel protein [Bacteroidota bacterium]
MKKTFLILATAMVGTFANAQTGAGSIMLGGNIGYTSTTTSKKITPAPVPPAVTPADVKSSTMMFQVIGGYFIMDGLAVGLGVDYGSSTSPNSSGSFKWDTKTSGFDIILFARKYMDVSDKFKMWGQGAFNYGSMTISDFYVTGTPPALIAIPDQKATLIGFNITPGFTFFPSEKWGIDFALANFIGYNSMSSETTAGPTTTKTTTSDIGININTMTPTLGLFYYIGKNNNKN